MLKTEGPWFKDAQQRTIILRGVNLGGSSKVPVTPNGATWNPESLQDPRNVSFVGRPFPLDEAKEHFDRLRGWGLTFLRLLVPWEAVEHEGPGVYDQEYLDYLQKLVDSAHRYGLSCFIDPHQDVWSRWTGGDGAPAWTLETMGMNLSAIGPTGAALTHQEHGDPLPMMSWPSNYAKIGAATMFTAFFGGRSFFPNIRVDDMNIQDFLQDRFIQAMTVVAEKLKSCPNVTGFDSLNEPHNGYIGIRDIRRFPKSILPRTGDCPTPLQSMAAADGLSPEIAVNSQALPMTRKTGNRVLNPEGVKLWRDSCPYREHGIWDIVKGTPRALVPDYFARYKAKPVNFSRDFLKPFQDRFQTSLARVEPQYLFFIEGIPNGKLPHYEKEESSGIVNATHWYDGITLVSKKYRPRFTIDPHTMTPSFGKKGVEKSFARQLARLKADSERRLNNAPTLVGEFGLPFDMNGKSSYRDNDFSRQEEAFTAYFDAMDQHMLSCTIWNYTSDNTNERGDAWNDEDLSIFSRDQQKNPGDRDSGGRALTGFVRPYVQKTAGRPIGMVFNPHTKTFLFSFVHTPGIKKPTEIFVPAIQYPHGYRIDLSDGSWETDTVRSCILWYHDESHTDSHTLLIEPIQNS